MPTNSKRLLFSRSGITLLELVAGISLMVILAGAAGYLVYTFISGQAVAQARQTMTLCAQEVATRLQHQLLQSRRLLPDSPLAQAYIQAMDLSQSGPMATWGRLPVLQPNGVLVPGTAGYVASAVGNQLLFVQVSTRASCDVSVPGNGGITVPLRFDLYSLRFYYLSEDTSQTLFGSPRLELWDWQSIDYPNLRQVQDASRITTVPYGNVLAALQGEGYAEAWDPASQSLSTAFRTIGATALTPISAPVIRCRLSVPRLFESVRLSGITMVAGVARNSPTSGPNPIPVTIPAYGTSNGSFPAGFEILMVGTPKARQILARFVMAGESQFKTAIAREETVYISAVDSW